MPMGFSHDPGPLPFVTVRDRDKWLPRLANGQIEIIGEHGVELPQQMVRVADVLEINAAAARLAGWHVPAIYAGRRLIAVRLEALDA